MLAPWIDGTIAGREDTGDLPREMFWLGLVIRLGGTVGSVPVYRAGYQGLNPGPSENFCLKLVRLKS